MKKQTMIWMALMAVLMTVAFTSCGKEDTSDDVIVDNGADKNPTITLTKRLVSFAYENHNKYLTNTDVTFTYDDQGFLKEATQINTYSDRFVKLEQKYTWSETSIVMTIETTDDVYGDSMENSTLTLDNGLVQKISSSDILKHGAKYSYDSSFRLSKANDFLADATYTWKDAQLMTVSSDGDGYSDVYTFEYGENSAVSGYCPLLPHRLTTVALYWAHPEIIGIMTNECPYKEINKSSGPSYTVSNTYTYEYEYDADGFVTKITEISEDDAEVYGIYTMTWE